ncbi:nitrogenase component 1 [Mogibacterium kristiansenii]|uniref:Oxidoreductase n=1 Tax=Mogibacterium kristiansenii TaxID=2606708 RepID=A0A6N7XJK0_9FIRM|nr:nitrogenase component 1 [Mogibacterium kristiansenii]MEE0369240.1 nitrogenase component 1 [Clostridia bacterium]MST70235.1 oxidoreductase [Mogibacterium kristiansenii]
MSDYQTHVFTSTYTADVSGVCSALYELGGMTVIHDPSGCNSTYSTHDEPRWFDTDSLMFVSGLDEMTAVLGDDNVLIDDVTHAVRDLKPRFVTLCSGSIPHIIAFDCKGVAHLLEKRTGVPMLPVTTTGNRSYVAGVGAALTEWVKRFADSLESPYRVSSSGGPDCSANTLEGAAGPESFSVNLLGVTPLDFSINGNVDAMRKVFEDAGIPVNCCAAMGESFDSLRHIFRASVNVVVSSCGRRLARYMEQTAGIPYVEGTPIGAYGAARLPKLAKEAYEKKRASLEEDSHGALDGTSGSLRMLLAKKKGDSEGICLWKGNPAHERWDVPDGQILIIGEEVFAQSLAAAINQLTPDCRHGLRAFAVWPDVDHGFPEDVLAELIRKSRYIIGDPLYRTIPHDSKQNTFVDFPHEAYSGRIFRDRIPVFIGKNYDVAELL